MEPMEPVWQELSSYYKKKTVKMFGHDLFLIELWKLQSVAPLSSERSQISLAGDFPLAPSLLITPRGSFLTNTHLIMGEFSSFLISVNVLCLLFYLPGLETMIFPYHTYGRNFSIWNRFDTVILSLDFGSGLAFISCYRITCFHRCLLAIIPDVLKQLRCTF